MIRIIRIDGFESIALMELPLGPMNCFIDTNGLGRVALMQELLTC